ncbi:MAG: sulfatase-like hydrolase/transferase [Verrucomicrobiaceae bacterium]
MKISLFFNLTLMLAVSIGSRVTLAADRPNILWVTCEDINPHLGCYGDTYSVSPNLDTLAKRGMIFTHAWSNGPVCAVARTTIISGMYPPSTGAEHMRSSVAMPQGCKMYPQFLREAGYYCTNHTKEDYNLLKPDGVWDDTTQKAHWRNRKPGQPFFAIFNILTTHESQIRKPGHKLVHDPAKAPLPPYMPDTPEVRHDWAQYYDNITTMDGEFAERLKELEDAGVAEDTIIMFYGDHGAGMPRSKRWPYNSGLQVPLIAYFPPKWQHLAPKNYQPGAKSPELVAFIDLAPTLLSIIGMKAPDYMQGRAFAGLLAKPAPEFMFGFRGRMDETYDLVRSVTDGHYVYLREYMPQLTYGQHTAYMFLMPTTQVWKRLFDEGKLNEIQQRFWQTKPTEELYDLQNDPWEIHNLALEGKHPSLAKLRQAEQQQCERIRDLGFIPEAERIRVCAGKSPRDVMQNDKDYPLADVLKLARLATDWSQKDSAPFVSALTHANATMRWWGVTGLLLRSDIREHDALVKLQNDESPSVRVAAAEALGTHGSADDLPKALEVLLFAANCRNAGWFAAVESLNAIHRLGIKAAPIKDKIAALPKKLPGVDSKLGDYIPRLIEKTLADLKP